MHLETLQCKCWIVSLIRNSQVFDSSPQIGGRVKEGADLKVKSLKTNLYNALRVFLRLYDSVFPLVLLAKQREIG